MIDSLDKVFEFYIKMNNGMSLERWESNKILDKYNWDKEMLFQETNEIALGLGKVGSLSIKSPMGEEMEIEKPDRVPPAFVDNQHLISIEGVNLRYEDLDKYEQAVENMIDVLGLIEGEYLRIKASVQEKHQEGVLYYVSYHAYSGDENPIEFSEFSKMVKEYCSEFFNETEITVNDEMNFIIVHLRDINEPKKDKE